MGGRKENEILSARHHAYVQRVMTACKNHGITATQLEPAEALVAVREAVLPETANSDWTPMIPGRAPMARLPDGEPQKGDAGLALWPALQDNLFFVDA